MPQDITTSTSIYNTKVPAITDTADIIAALTNYHYGVENGTANDNATTGIVGMLKKKANLASPTFTGKVIVDGYTQGPTTTIVPLFYQPGAQGISNSTTSIEAADLLQGILTVSITANKSLALPTGTDLDSAITTAIGSENLTVGLSFIWYMARTTSGYGLSLSTSTGHGMIAPGSSPFSSWQDGPASFLTRRTGTNTWVTYWLGR
jgi:hypothetical protein